MSKYRKKEKNQEVKDDTEKQPPQDKKRRRGVKINAPKDVNRLLNRLINKVLHEPSPSNIEILRSIAYASQVVLKCFEQSDLADRLAALEEKLGISKGSP